MSNTEKPKCPKCEIKMFKKSALILLTALSFAYSKEVVITGKIIGAHYQGVGGGYGIEPIDGTKGSEGRDFLYLCFFWDNEKIVNTLRELEQSEQIVTIRANRTKKSFDVECDSIKIASRNADIFNNSSAKLTDSEYEYIKKNSPEYASSDAELSRTYAKLKKSLNLKQKEDLKDEQVKWIGFRDQKVYEAGKKGSQRYIDALIRLTKERIAYLNTVAK